MRTNHDVLRSVAKYTSQFLQAGLNQTQRLWITGAPSGGTFQLTVNGEQTGPIAPTATSNQVHTAIAALPSPRGGDLWVEGVSLLDEYGMVAYFRNGLGWQHVDVTVQSALTGGTSPQAWAAVDQEGRSGEEWEVRLWGEEGTLVPPFARVAFTGPTTYAGPGVNPLVTKPMTIHLYPVPGDTEEESVLRVAWAEELLFTGFEVGVGLGWPERIPLWDFNASDELNVSSERRFQQDYVRLVPGSLNVSQLPDPEDEREITVVADFRAQWHRVGRVLSGGKIVESVRSNVYES